MHPTLCCLLTYLLTYLLTFLLTRYVKGGRDVEATVWGFELAHNDGPHEALDVEMTVPQPHIEPHPPRPSSHHITSHDTPVPHPPRPSSHHITSHDTPVPHPPWARHVTRMLTIPGPHVIIACGQSLLQDGFAAAARTTAGNVMPCGLLAATPASATNVTAAPATVAMKAHVMGLPKGSAVPLPMLPSSGVECDPTKLEARIDWSVWQSRGSCNACISYTRSLLFACNSAHIQRE